MNIKIAYILASLVILSNAFGFGQTSQIPHGFIATNTPNPGDGDWYALNNSGKKFGVKIIDGKLEVRRVKENNVCELKLESGTLIGINRGEWGGTLTFKPNDTSKKSIDIKRGNIKFIFTFKNRIYFIEGLAHLSVSQGAMYELNISDDKFTFTKIVDFDDAPEAFTIYHEKFLIATHSKFYVVENFKKELVFENTFWNSLYPNSIAPIDDHNIYIGIRRWNSKN